MRVLIAEDVPSDAELVVRELKKTFDEIDYRIVDSEKDFVNGIENFKPELILSDYVMPSFDGLTALKIALNKIPFIPFIILTGSMNEATAVECMKAGATDYVIKEHILRLGSAIESALKKKKIEKQKHITQEELIDNQKRLKKLTAAQSLSEEKQRREIASDIHDYISQSLVFSKIKLTGLLSKVTDPKIKTELEEIHTNVSSALQKTRNITEDLSPPVLYELGLFEGLQWLCEKTTEEHNLITECNLGGLHVDLTDDNAIIIFRIIQELLVNIVKHANAKKALVSVKVMEDSIEYSVSDDGIGIDAIKAFKQRKGFGLFHIREQIENLGGTLEIERVDSGTLIVFVLPKVQ